MKEGDRIRFTYKGGRRVVAKVLRVGEKTIITTLETNYSGQNQFWEIGETKAFNVGEMKGTEVVQ